MRTISTDGLKPLGPDGSGPWRLDGGLLLRTSSNGRLLRTMSEAQAVLDSYRTARLAGIDSPAPVEVVRTDGGFGAVVEYVQGLGIGPHLLIGSYTPKEVGCEMAAILRGLHAARAEGGRDWNGVFREWTHDLSALLPHKVGERLSSLVRGIPASSSLLHGDMHLGNVIVRDGRLAIIDMESVGFGHPMLDLAITRSRMFFTAPAEAERVGAGRKAGEQFAHDVWDVLLSSYFDGAGEDELAGLDRRLAVLAEVESCCCEYRIGRVGAHGLSDRQKERLALCSQRLEALLPQVERLDFADSGKAVLEAPATAAQATGVDWCRITVSNGLLELVGEAQSNEDLVQALCKSDSRRLLRVIATDGVGAASDMATDASIGEDELFRRCFALRGEPYEEAGERRDMRERIRVLQRIEGCGDAVPRTLDDVLDLWSQATRGEVPLYAECETAQFRTSRVPFGHRGNPFEPAEPRAGRQTVEAGRIPDETAALLAFMAREDLPCEVVAAAAYFLCCHIHPFADGNGRLSRMLSCILLAGRYSPVTVLAFLRRMQAERGTMNLAIERTVRTRGDLEEIARLFLETLCAAQRDLLPAKAGFAVLPLRFVQARRLDLLTARKPGREVYRTENGRILKMLAKRGRLGRACAVYEAVSAAYEAGAAIARPDGLVRTECGYAMVLEFVDGPPLANLVAQGRMSPEEAGATMARCLAQLHAVRGDATRMRDVREPFLRMAEGVSPWLSAQTAEALRSLIMGVPAAATIVHGDVHMGNVIMGADGTPILIDADTVSMGAPVFDLACAYSAMVCEAAIDPKRAEKFHGMPTETVEAVWESLLRRYCADTGMARSEKADWQMQTLAWLVVLNRLNAVGNGKEAFGEEALRILQATSCLAKALGHVAPHS